MPANYSDLSEARRETRKCPVCGNPTEYSPELNRRFCTNPECPMNNRRTVEREA